MSMLIGTISKINHFVLFRQLVRRWRKNAAKSSRQRRITGGQQPVPADVPAGYLAVYVGDSQRRFVVRAAYLNHPIFQKLLVQTAEEYGFTNQGPLIMLCEESEFEQVVRFVSTSSSRSAARFVNVEVLQRMCQLGCRMTNSDLVGESWPLLGTFPDKVC